MLLNTFFEMEVVTQTQNEIEVLCTINAEHAILKGHFPDMPIVPGVCMIDMLQEIIKHVHSQNLQLSTISNVKFLNYFLPNENCKASFKIKLIEKENKQQLVSATLFQQEKIMMKFSGIFIDVN